ncbi:SCO6880 family protein [Kitasatospora sp. NPDC001119]
MTSPEEPATYGGWQRERGPYLGELSLGGLVTVAGAGLVAMLPVYTHAWAGEIVAVPVALLLLAAVYLRVYGLTAAEWAVLAVRFEVAVVRRQTMFFSGAFAPRRSDGSRRTDLPGVLARLEFLTVPTGAGREIGVVHDPLQGHYSAIMEVRYPGIALADTARVNARVSGWGGFLRGHCVEGGPIVRISVTDRSAPEDGTALMAWTTGHLDRGAPAAAHDLVTALAAEAAPAASTRRTYLTVTLAASRVRQDIRSSGGGTLGATAVLVRELLAMQGAIAAADLQVVATLTVGQIAEVIRTAYDPGEAPVLAAHAAAACAPGWAGTPPGVDESAAGPAAAEQHWGRYRHDSGVSASFEVYGWPEGRVYASVLTPLMSASGNARRSVSLTYECLGARTARATLSRERTKADVKRRVRARGGRIESLDERKALVDTQDQDHARTAGHGIARFTGVVTVTVDEPGELALATARLKRDAYTSGLRLRELYAAQDSGFAATLPLGLGLPVKRRAVI